jgi:hypothetical protein
MMRTLVHSTFSGLDNRGEHHRQDSKALLLLLLLLLSRHTNTINTKKDFLTPNPNLRIRLRRKYL